MKIQTAKNWIRSNEDKAEEWGCLRRYKIGKKKFVKALIYDFHLVISTKKKIHFISFPFIPYAK